MRLGPVTIGLKKLQSFSWRIPEATKQDVLIIAMTNRIDMIDPAILRRGRFDHVIKVDYASEMEVMSLLENLLRPFPRRRMSIRIRWPKRSRADPYRMSPLWLVRAHDQLHVRGKTGSIKRAS
ncbi:MAG: AAA family ATPase [Nitrospira sp.]